jgi:hypothetical protein
LRLCADENVAPLISDLIRETLLSGDFTLDCIDDHQARGVDDQIWVRKFADAGGEAIVGGDAAMLSRPNEVIAIHQTGLRLIVLDPKWPRQKRHIQISYLFYWWPHIEEALRSSGKGACLRVPWGWGETGGAIKPANVDLQKAYKLRKRGRF